MKRTGQTGVSSKTQIGLVLKCCFEYGQLSVSGRLQVALTIVGFLRKVDKVTIDG